MAVTYITLTSGTSWTVPTDWDSSNNTIHLIGGGASTLTGWTTSITAGDILGFNVDSITTCKQVTLTIKVTKTS